MNGVLVMMNGVLVMEDGGWKSEDGTGVPGTMLINLISFIHRIFILWLCVSWGVDLRKKRRVRDVKYYT